MTIENLLKKRNMTKYRLAVDAGIPHATLNDICSGKTRLEKCSAETVYKLAKALGVSMELLTVEGIRQAEKERSYEYGLPAYLQHDLDAYKEGHKTNPPCWTACGESSTAVSISQRLTTGQSQKNMPII